MKRQAWLSLLVLASLTTATACSSSNDGNGGSAGSAPAGSAANASPSAAEKPDPYGKLAEPVTFSIGKLIPASSSENYHLPEGSKDNLKDNEYTRLLSDKLNVNFTHAFEVKQEGYDQKVNMAIASNDIPDVMVVNYDQFRLMADSDQLENLTEVYRDYASPLIKEIYDSGDDTALQMATYDGKLMAIPNVTMLDDSSPLVWVRQDWLTKLNLDPPKTVEQLEKVLQAFATSDVDGKGKKSPLPGSQDLNFDGIFAAYDAYPKTWLKDASGNVVYGSITPEAKAGLTELHDLYAKGLIDQQFAVKTGDQVNADVVSGKTGLFFGPWWSPMWPLTDAIKTDPNADWQAYMLEDAQGKYSSKQNAAATQFVVVKKGVQHPEAIMKTLNLLTEVQKVEPGAPKVYGGTGTVDWSIRPLEMLIDYPDTLERVYKDQQNVIAGKGSPTMVQEDQQKLIDNNKKGLETVRKTDPGTWSNLAAWFIGAKPFNEGEELGHIYSAYYGKTPSMELKWVNLEKLENDAYLSIITGDKPIDYFDTFVSNWKKQGGDDITKEVQEASAK